MLLLLNLEIISKSQTFRHSMTSPLRIRLPYNGAYEKFRTHFAI